MKKLVLILFAGISFAAAHAQGQVQFGIKGGLNLSTVTVSNGYDGYSYNTLPNFNAGLFLKIPVVRFFSIQPEVYYSGQGYKGNDGSTGDYSVHLDYLNIPVLFRFATRSGLYLETGPQIGILLSAKQNQEGVSTDASSGFNSVDFSWAFGVGYKFPMSPLGIDFRYNAGIINVANDGSGYYGNGYDQYAVRNDVFQLGLTVVLWKSSGDGERPSYQRPANRYRRY